MGAGISLPGTDEEALEAGFAPRDIDAFKRAIAARALDGGESFQATPAKALAPHRDQVRTEVAESAPPKRRIAPAEGSGTSSPAGVQKSALWSGKVSLLCTIAARIEKIAAEAEVEDDAGALNDPFSQQIFALADTIEGIQEKQWKKAKVEQLQTKMREASDLVQDDDDAATFEAVRENVRLLQAKLTVKAKQLTELVESERQSLPDVNDQVRFWQSLKTLEEFYRDLSNVARRPRTAP